MIGVLGPPLGLLKCWNIHGGLLLHFKGWGLTAMFQLLNYPLNWHWWSEISPTISSLALKLQFASGSNFPLGTTGEWFLEHLLNVLPFSTVLKGKKMGKNRACWFYLLLAVALITGSCPPLHHSNGYHVPLPEDGIAKSEIYCHSTQRLAYCI